MDATLTPSPLDKINSALENHNPFAQPPFVNANNVWGKGFPDVESLNAHASDAVFQTLEDIRAGRYQTTSLLITAQDGTGKTHIISRIRHRLQAQGGALFVFANKFNDLNQIKPGFQQILADSLSHIGSQGVKQWQELATAMANDVLKAGNSNTSAVAPKNLVKKFENISEEQALKWVTQLTKGFCKIKSVKDRDIVRAIFWTLVEEESSYASNWLAGKELAQFKAKDLGLPNQNQSFDAVLQTLALISEYNELVICFDELDTLDFNDAGLHKSQIVANLVKELFENLHRGTILTVMMPGTWKERVQKELPGGVSSKMTAQGTPYDLRYLDSDTTIDLVTLFLKEYYEARELIPPQPVYPFDEGQLRAIGREKPTVREVLKWCRENCKPVVTVDPGGTIPPNPPVTPPNPVEFAFMTEMSEELDDLDNNYLLADALLFGFQGLIGKTVERVTLNDVTTGVDKKGKKDDYLNFKVLGKEEDSKVSIGVAVLQYDGGGGLGAGFRRLLDKDKKFDLTRGCLVRSKAKPINGWFQKNYLDPLIKQGGEFVELTEEEIKPLIAIRAVYQKRESDYEVTEAEIFKFIEERGAKYFLGIHNPLLREILSDPSYTMPSDIQDEPESSNLDDFESDISEDFNSTDANDLAELAISNG